LAIQVVSLTFTSAPVMVFRIPAMMSLTKWLCGLYLLPAMGLHSKLP